MDQSVWKERKDEIEAALGEASQKLDEALGRTGPNQERLRAILERQLPEPSEEGGAADAATWLGKARSVLETQVKDLNDLATIVERARVECESDLVNCLRQMLNENLGWLVDNAPDAASRNVALDLWARYEGEVRRKRLSVLAGRLVHMQHNVDLAIREVNNDLGKLAQLAEGDGHVGQ